MPKTIKSEIFDAEIKQQLWLDIANDNEALECRGKTKEQALKLADYFEGRAGGLRDSAYYK